MTEQPTQELVHARASIHLPGLPLGSEAFVDSSDPYIADALERGYLVAVEATPEPVPDPEPPSETGKEEE